MFNLRNDGINLDPDEERPVAFFVDSFITALGTEDESDTVILRLFHKDWPNDGREIPPKQVHQFVMNAPRAVELGQQLLAYAAQVEKETGAQVH